VQYGLAMRPAKKPMKAPFVVTISAVAAAASLVAGCGGKVPGASEEHEFPSNPPGPPITTTCSSTTQAGDPCARNETTCTPSSSLTLGCANGKWENKSQIIGNPPFPEQCPIDEPTDGDRCWQGSNGTTQQLCSYADTCKLRPRSAPDFRTYHCYKSGWQRTTPAYTAECPSSPPQSGESCAACAGSLPAECTYGPSDSPCPPAVAVCDPTTLKWTVAITSCNPPPPPQDAGAP
jgi:hypothetical protein